jgi:hypothetical protein
MKPRIWLAVASLAFLTFAGFAQSHRQQPSRGAQDQAVAKLNAILADAVSRHSTPPILADDEAVQSLSGDVTLTGRISRAGAPFDLGRFGEQFRGLRGQAAVLRNGGNIAFTVTCLVDLNPCAETTEGMWTLTPTYDPERMQVRWTVMHYSPLTLKLLDR